MIIDPESFVPLEVERRLSAARSSRPATDAPRRQHRLRRGVTLRLAAWATGRTALV